MENNFSFEEQSTEIDFKLLLLKIVKHWKWYVITLLISFFIAHYINVRKQNVYELKNIITVKDETNPWFTSNMSLVFNWGGVSDKVNLLLTTLQSRTHNEKVVKKLKFYITYLKKEKYNLKDIYNKSPFIFIPDSNAFQLINTPIKIKKNDEKTLTIKITPKNKEVILYNYLTNEKKKILSKEFVDSFKLGQHIDLPVLKGKFIKNPNIKWKHKDIYFLKLGDFHSVVNYYKQNLKIKNKNKNSSILVLSLKGTNKDKIADYLNTTTDILKVQILNDKNKFAVNTIKFIDSILSKIHIDLTQSTNELQEFIKNKSVLNLDDPSGKLYEKITSFDLQKNKLLQKKMYYQQLLKYLQNRKNYEDLPAPTVVGIDDPTIIDKITRITQLSILRKKNLTNFKENSLPIKKMDLEIETLRKTLLETINSALSNIDSQLAIILKRLKKVEQKINTLPQEKQTLLALKRKYDLQEEVYNNLLQKRNEASIVKASNVSDLKIIDNAKDVGQAPVAPNRMINYLIALAAGLLLPTLIIVILFFADTKIHDISEVEKQTDLPVLGQIYHYDGEDNLPVKSEPNGLITESFRTLRSALRFIFPNKTTSQTILITSTISGEGKTFISSNLGLILAMSNKKTVILEFDLRKPKFHQYFKEAKHTNKGISHFLVDDAKLDEIIIPTEFDNLDIILSGDIPPNPSELILREETTKLFEKLKERYDFIIIDVPPIGVVSDALELQKYADVILFVVREDYSEKSFVKDIEEKYGQTNDNHLAIIYNDYKASGLKKYGYKGNAYRYQYGNYFEPKKTGIKKLIENIRNFFKRSKK